MSAVIELEGLRFPADYYYLPDHVWLRVEKNGTTSIGIDDFEQKAAGQIVFTDLPDVGTRIKQFETLACIEGKKLIVEVISPISGTVIRINEDILDDPSLINEDPYFKGWMVRVKPDDLKELKNLIHGEESIVNWAKHDIETILKEMGKG